MHLIFWPTAPYPVRNFNTTYIEPRDLLLSWTEPEVKNGQLKNYTITYNGTKTVGSSDEQCTRYMVNKCIYIIAEFKCVNIHSEYMGEYTVMQSFTGDKNWEMNLYLFIFLNSGSFYELSTI